MRAPFFRKPVQMTSFGLWVCLFLHLSDQFRSWSGRLLLSIICMHAYIVIVSSYSLTLRQFWVEPTHITSCYSSDSDDDGCGWVCWSKQIVLIFTSWLVYVRTTYPYKTVGAIKTILWRVYRKISYRKCWINGNVIKVYINLLTLIKMKRISSMNEVKIHHISF
jgi:hypothetical protein